MTSECTDKKDIDDTVLYTDCTTSQFSGNTEDWSNSYVHLPTNFLGLNLKNLGNTRGNIFWNLKNLIDSDTTTFEDRTQGVRYLMRSPYIHAIKESINSVIKIVDFNDYNVYSRYLFFSNNEKYLRLNDNITHEIHPYWFITSTPKKHPKELTMLTCRFLLRALSPGDTLRHSVLEYILDTIECNEYADTIKADACDVLITCGEFDEIDYGQAKLKKLIISQNTNPDSVYNSQSVHNSSFTESAIKILRVLHGEYNLHSSIDFLRDIITAQVCLHSGQLEDPSHTIDKINKFFYRIMTDSTKFNDYTILDCLYLVGKKIQDLHEDYKTTAIQRLIEEILDAQDTCSTGYLIRIVNVLSGLTTESDLILRLDPKQELKCVINTRLSDMLGSVPTAQRESIIESIDILRDSSEDEDAVYTIKKFIDYSMLYDDLQDDYIGQKLISQDEFDQVWKNTMYTYFGAQIFL